MSYKFLDKYDYLTPLSIQSTESTLVSESLNLRRKVVKKNAQRFDISITVMGGKNQKLHADLMAHWMTYGADTPFSIPVPQPLYTEEDTTQTSPVYIDSVTAAAGSTTINLNSLGAYSISSGRFIKFGNHSKVYMVISYNSTVGNQSEIVIKPALVSNVPADTVVDFMTTQAYVLNEPDNSVFNFTDGVIQEATLKFVEHLV